MKRAKIVIAGDLFPVPSQEKDFTAGNIEKIFDKEIIDVFHDSDYAVCNLEGCLTDIRHGIVKSGVHVRANPKVITTYNKLGINAVSLANNHANDYGNQGYMDTVLTLDNAGIDYFGAGKSAADIKTHIEVTVNGLNIVFYGVSEQIFNKPDAETAGANLYQELRVCQQLNELKAHCDYLVVLYHGGIENFHYTTETVRSRFRDMANHGADLVISQHTHAIGLEEHYKSSYFLYGQGNFCFHLTKKIHEWNEKGLLSEFIFSEDGIIVKHHVVKRAGTRVEYDREQDLSNFYSRSERNKNGDTFLPEFQKYADAKFMSYLREFRGENKLDKIVKKLLSPAKYDKYLLNCYSKSNLLWIQKIIQSEEFGEIARQGIIDIIREKLHK